MRRSLAVGIALMFVVASVPMKAVSNPAITGTISGVELCPQSICREAVFAGNFAGLVKAKPTAGVFWAGITHEDLPTTEGDTAAITGGSWLIRTRTRVFTGAIEDGGYLTYNGDNTFTVHLTMDLDTGGKGTLTFDGLLDHNPFPPTIVGFVSQ